MHAGLPLTGSSSLQTSWSMAWAWEGKAARSFPEGPQVGEGRTNTAEARPGPGVGERCFRGVTWVDVTGWACLHRTGGVTPSRLWEAQVHRMVTQAGTCPSLRPHSRSSGLVLNKPQPLPRLHCVLPLTALVLWPSSPCGPDLTLSSCQRPRLSQEQLLDFPLSTQPEASGTTWVQLALGSSPSLPSPCRRGFSCLLRIMMHVLTELCPPHSYVEVLTPSISKCDCCMEIGSLKR